MTTSTLYNLDVPDKLDKLELKEASPKEIMKIAYNAWLETSACDDDYDFLYDTARRINAPYADTLVGLLKEKSLPLLSKCEKWRAGLFLSGICGATSGQEIVCGNEMELARLAYRLPKGKTFINNGKAGRLMGEHAEGTVINYKKTGGQMGELANGLVVNYGKTDEGLGENSEGLVVNCGSAKDWLGGHAKGVVINYGKAGYEMGDESDAILVNCGEANKFMGRRARGPVIAVKNPKNFSRYYKGNTVLKEQKWYGRSKMPEEIIDYFDELKAVLDEGKKDYRALARLPSSQKIKKEVKAILKARGYLK